MAENRKIPSFPAELWKNMSFVNAFNNYFNMSSPTFNRLMNNNLFNLWVQ